ncbi:MAG: acyltransferase [Bacteroidaceae bacterium]|nr:acyltransferase [Bacteroidaceae bacterium]
MIKKVIKKIKALLLSPEAYAKSKGVKMGKGCYFSTKEIPAEGYLIEIGDYVRVASHTSFYTHGGLWSIRQYYKDNDLDWFGKIKIGSYTSIGSHCMIMPGVTIGERVIVGGGSVVTKSVPDGVVVAGNPARIVGYTDDLYKKVKEKYDLGCKHMSTEEKRKFLLAQSENKYIRKPLMKQNSI